MLAKFFQDKHGNTVIAQTANLPLIAWLALVVINFFVHSAILGWLATAFLFIWALLEIFQGVSYFRRLLGLVVLAGLVIMHLG